MDMFQYAMNLEKEGETLYRELAQQSPNNGLATILNWLADEEAKHYTLFKQMQDNESPVLEESRILQNAKSVFAEMKQQKDNFNFHISQPDFYRKALAIEKMTEEFYSQKADEVENEKHKELFRAIAHEEGRLYFLLENIIEFISKPEIWVENAEFNHFEDYYD